MQCTSFEFVILNALLFIFYDWLWNARWCVWMECSGEGFRIWESGVTINYIHSSGLKHTLMLKKAGCKFSTWSAVHTVAGTQLLYNTAWFVARLHCMRTCWFVSAWSLGSLYFSCCLIIHWFEYSIALYRLLSISSWSVRGWVYGYI